MALLRPCGTPLCMAMASSSFRYFITYRIGAKVSVWTISASLRSSTMVGCTNVRAPNGESTLPPQRILPPCFFAASSAFSKSLTAPSSISGPISVAGSSGSPMRTRL